MSTTWTNKGLSKSTRALKDIWIEKRLIDLRQTGLRLFIFMGLSVTGGGHAGKWVLLASSHTSKRRDEER